MVFQLVSHVDELLDRTLTSRLIFANRSGTKANAAPEDRVTDHVPNGLARVSWAAGVMARTRHN